MYVAGVCVRLCTRQCLMTRNGVSDNLHSTHAQHIFSWSVTIQEIFIKRMPNSNKGRFPALARKRATKSEKHVFVHADARVERSCGQKRREKKSKTTDENMKMTIHRIDKVPPCSLRHPLSVYKIKIVAVYYRETKKRKEWKNYGRNIRQSTSFFPPSRSIVMMYDKRFTSN